MERDLWPIRFVEQRPGRENGEEEQRRLHVKATSEGGGARVASVACISGGGLAGPAVKKLLGPMMLMADAKACRSDSLCGLDS
jgi:hypothetical protein